MRHHFRGTGSIIPAVLGLAAMAFMPYAIAADGNGGTVYLDPNNGNVIEGPGVPDNQKNAQGSDSSSSDAGDSKQGTSYQPWQTKDGTPMLKVTPGKNAGEQVVHCPDGSLRMGQVLSENDQSENRQSGESSREALCNKS